MVFCSEQGAELYISMNILYLVCKFRHRQRAKSCCFTEVVCFFLWSMFSLARKSTDQIFDLVSGRRRVAKLRLTFIV